MASSASQSDVELSRVAMAIIRLPLRNRHSGTERSCVGCRVPACGGVDVCDYAAGTEAHEAREARVPGHSKVALTVDLAHDG